jgi:hypothetical protein
MTQASHILTDLPLNDVSSESEISQNLQGLSDQLQKLVKNAKKVRSEPFQVFKDELSRKLLRLRPSVNGISAISCCEETPQLGFPKISIRKLEKIMKDMLLPPGRGTPEKKLQSWLIQSALKSDGRLTLLDEGLGGQHWLVSDEIALTNASKEKMVADLLLVRVDADGLAVLVNAELKSDRLMEAFRQVIRFRVALEDPGLREAWKAFAEVMTGQKFQWHPSQETRGLVIWPAVGPNPTKARANGRRKDYARVDVIGYRCDSGINEYTLEIEKLC